MISRRRLLFAAAGASLTPVAASAATVQPYPHRPVKIITAGLPGAPFDLIARAIADKLAAKLKQTFVVESRPGAGGNLGAEFVSRAAPDGYTLLMALGTTFTVNPSLHKKLPFNPQTDLRFLSIVAATDTMLVVHPSVPVSSVPEFVALARTEPLTYAHGGNGTPGHLTMEYFRLAARFVTNPVPYRGNGPAVTDLVSGQVKFGFVATAGVVDHVRAGRLKGLAISASKRSPLAPDVPRMADVGYPDFVVESYQVLAAPAAIASPIAALLEQEVQLALQSPDLREKFRALGIEVTGTTGAEATARIKADAELWAKIVKAAGMHID